MRPARRRPVRSWAWFPFSFQTTGEWEVRSPEPSPWGPFLPPVVVLCVLGSAPRETGLPGLELGPPPCLLL